MGRKRRHSKKSRRHSRKNPNYFVMKPNKKGHRKGRLRRNFMQVYGKDIVTDIAMPAAWATGGFLAANALSNMAAGSDQIRGVLDAGRAPDAALATKSVANAAVIAAALGAAAWAGKSGNKMISENATPVLTGMGLALLARLLRGTALAPYLGRLGEYVDQPMSGFGEYVDQPMSGLGAYVNDPTHGMGAETYYAAAGMGQTYYAAAGYHEGIDPANQEGVDGLMDVMEAAAGTPHEAAAGVGEYVDQPMSGLGDATYYAAAGLGQAGEADSTLAKFYAKNQPPWASIQTPLDGAVPVTKVMPRDNLIPTSLVTPEGKGFAGGLFARNLFAGMF